MNPRKKSSAKDALECFHRLKGCAELVAAVVEMVTVLVTVEPLAMVNWAGFKVHVGKSVRVACPR